MNVNNRPKPVTLIILDGWGVSTETKGNAILAANTPNYDSWLKNYPNTLLKCSGLSVGLPEGQMGNSEVGHLNIGAGRVVHQEFTRISEAIKNGSFFTNPEIVQAIQNTKMKNSHLHLMGLLSDGGVHSHNTHLYDLLKMAKEKRVECYLHVFLDGRDVPPQSSLKYIQQLEDKIKEIGVGQIVTIMGRFYAMDRDTRWDRVEKAYKAMVYGQGQQADSAISAIENAYERGETDEFVLPTVIEVRGERREVRENDSLIFFNFRPDRAREITRAFIEPDFQDFNRGSHPVHVFFVSMTEYDATFDVPVAFPPQKLTNILADILANHHLKQLRLAETEKYAHVTFFFNGGEENKRALEERILIPSPKITTYDLKPEMSAYAVTYEAIKQIQKDIFGVVIINYANPDMVGHSGNFDATVKAIETIDDCLGKAVTEIKSKKGICLITADHGNAEKMIELETGKPLTAHTTNKVPFIFITPSPFKGKGQSEGVKLRDNGILADVAPTMLDILGIEKPAEMSGESLII